MINTTGNIKLLLNMNKNAEISQIRDSIIEDSRSSNQGQRTTTYSCLSDKSEHGNENRPTYYNNLVKIIGMTIEENTERRKDILASLEEKIGCPVISYIANEKVDSQMEKEDIIMLSDFIEQASRKSNKIAIIINSLGGDADAVVKQIHILRDVFKDGIQILVPHRAKSAATLLAIGADKIIMGEQSELGPIDPIIIFRDLSGNRIFVQAKAYLKSIDGAKELIKSEKDRDIRHTLMEKFSKQFDFSKMEYCREALRDFEKYGRIMLQNGVMKGMSQDDINNTIHILIDGEMHHEHTSSINAAEAIDKLKLNVEFWDMHDEKWKALWEYFELADNLLHTTGISKIFESKSSEIALLQRQAKQDSSYKTPPADDLKSEKRSELTANKENAELAPIIVKPIRK